ncbi:MAG: PQQ-binding-like beta-propeller repeat protein, partial [Haloarculaceae archaeon]
VGLAGCGADTDSTEPAGDTPDPTPAGVTDSPDGSRSPTERTATSTDPPELEPAWTVGDLSRASAAVSLALPDGTRTREPASVDLHAATETGTLLRVDPSDGSVGWRTSTRLPVDGDDRDVPDLFGIWRLGDALLTVAGDPAADDPYTTIVCRDPATGEERWHDRRREILAPLDVRDGAVSVAGEYLRKPTDELAPSEPRSRSGRLRALDLQSGTVEAEATIDSSFSVVAADHGLYVQRQRADDGSRYSVVAFDRDLTRRWQVDTQSQIGRSLATTDDGVLYTVDGELALLDAASGDTRWTVGGWTDPPRGPDVLPDGTVYAGVDPVKQVSPDGEVLNTLSGGVGGDAVASPSTGWVYLDDTGALYRVDRTTGEVGWTYRAPAEDYTDVAALPGESVVATRGIDAVTILDVLDGATGDVRGEVRVGRGLSEAAAVGGLLVVASHGRLGGYDTSTVL